VWPAAVAGVALAVDIDALDASATAAMTAAVMTATAARRDEIKTVLMRVASSSFFEFLPVESP